MTLIIEIFFYIFKFATTKYSLCFKSFFLCLKHLKKECGHVLFFVAKYFFLVKCAPIFYFIFNLSYTSQEGLHVFKPFKNILYMGFPEF